MKTMKQFVHDAEGMILTAGWKEIFIPEVELFRKSLEEEILYGDEPDPLELKSKIRSVRVLDQILGFEGRVAEMAEQLKNDPQDESNVVHSAKSSNE